MGGVMGTGAPDTPPTGASTDTASRTQRPGELMTVLPAVPVSASVARTLLTSWLTSIDWPDTDQHDIVIAVNEAIANVIDHAYPPGTVGRVHLHAWSTLDHRNQERRVIAAITDRGSWRHEHRRPGSEHRGRGLLMMTGCMAEVHIECAAGGTSIVLVSTPAPAR
jgi:serine/threonine-protein kinase RsbW